MKGRILVVDDERSIRDMVAEVLGYEGYTVSTAASGTEAIALYRLGAFDLVLMDVKMQGIDGIETLHQLRLMDPKARVVMISGHGTIQTAVQSVKEGAFDFMEKPLDSSRLFVTVKLALEHGRLEGEVARLRERLARATDTKSVMVGESEGLDRIRDLVARVAPTNARVLISGENGSGKELVARAIHEGSPRWQEPFIEVNCAAIPSELVESELFGHAKGSFTGAIGTQTGKFDAADGGTLFLDEIGDLALNAQAKILRALQESVITRVGDSKAIPIDVRVIAATNRDLAEEIAAGRFREDLFFRLNVMPIEVPPLRDRSEDIPALVKHFVDVIGSGPGMSAKTFLPGALKVLQRRRWAGNVRELKNAVERLLILSPGFEVTEWDVEQVLPHEAGSQVDVGQLASDARHHTLFQFRDVAERMFIMARLREHDWNIAETARVLGIPRSNLYAKMEKFEIPRENP